MPDIVIRPFQPGDEAGIVGVILPIQQDEFAIPITAEQQPDLLAIPAFYLPGAGGFWVAEADGTIVGTIALKDIGNRQAALRKMFVAKNWRGAAKQVASLLLEKLLSHAAASALDEIYLGTTQAFKAAHRFYEKNGFDEVAKSTLPENFPVMAVDTKFYRLNLLDRR